MKRSFHQILCSVFLGAALMAGTGTALADAHSEGMALFKAKKYAEAAPLLEKAAAEGHEDALEALDVIYKDAKAPEGGKDQAVPEDEDDDAKEAREKREREALKKKYSKYMLKVEHDEEEAERRAKRNKWIFIGTAVILVIIWIITKLIMRRMKSAHEIRMEIEQAKREKERAERAKAGLPPADSDDKPTQNP